VNKTPCIPGPVRKSNSTNEADFTATIFTLAKTKPGSIVRNFYEWNDDGHREVTISPNMHVVESISVKQYTSMMCEQDLYSPVTYTDNIRGEYRCVRYNSNGVVMYKILSYTDWTFTLSGYDMYTDECSTWPMTSTRSYTHRATKEWFLVDFAATMSNARAQFDSYRPVPDEVTNWKPDPPPKPNPEPTPIPEYDAVTLGPPIVFDRSDPLNQMPGRVVTEQAKLYRRNVVYGTYPNLDYDGYTQAEIRAKAEARNPGAIVRLRVNPESVSANGLIVPPRAVGIEITYPY